MGIIIRQSLKTALVTYVGIVIGTINILWLAPKFLKPEEIGLTRILADVAILLASFVQLGSSNIADRFFPYFKNEERKHHGFFMFLIIYPLIGFIVFTFLFLFFRDSWINLYKDKSPLLTHFFYEIIPLTFFIMYTTVLEAYVRIHYRIVVPGIIREIFVRVAFSAFIVLYFMGLVNLEGFIILIILSYGLSVFLLLGYIKKLGRFYLNFDKSLFKKSLVKDMGYFSLFIILGGAGSLIASKIDTIMLGSMTGLELTGVYSIAFYIGSIIEVPRKAIAQISVPLISQAWRNNELEQIHDLYKKTALTQFIIGGLLFLLVWCNVDSLLNLIPNSQYYKEGKYVIFFIALGRLINMGTGVSSEIIINSKYYRFYLISIVILGLLTVITNYIFIPVYGINGAAATTVFCILCFNILNYLFLWIKLGIQPFTGKIGIAFLIFLGSYLIASIINLQDSSLFNSIQNIVLRSIVLCVVYIGAIYFLKVSEDINKVAFQILKRVGIIK